MCFKRGNKMFTPTTNCLSLGFTTLKMPGLLVLLLVILFNQATCAQLGNFASLPKCKDSSLGDQVDIPRAFLLKSELNNSTRASFKLNLTAQTGSFRCDDNKGRMISLNASVKMQLAYQKSQKVGTVLTFLQSGYAVHDTMYYSQKDYCLQSVQKRNGSTISISTKLCEPICYSTKKNPCIQKCCEPDKVWDLKDYISEGSLSCEKSAGGNSTWKPTFYYGETNEKPAKILNIRYRQAHPRHFCSDEGFFMMTLKKYNDIDASPFRVLSTGKAEMKVGPSKWEPVPSGQYCIDGAMNFDSPFENKYSGKDEDTIMLVCTDWMDDPSAGSTSTEGTINYLYVVAMLVSSVFLFLTAVVYALLWSRQSVHGWTFLGYVVSLLLTFLFLSTAHLSTAANYDCTLVGIACHFFFISCFSWLTALNFDVFWTFRSLNPYPGRKKEVLRFLYYSIFAVGTPTTFVAVGLILEKIYGDDPNSDVIVPRYGVTRCTMERSAELPYLFGPISVLLGCNFILFPSTVYLVWKSRKVTKLSGMKNSMLKHKMWFLGKLLLLAGLTWIFEIVSWLCTTPDKPVHWVWKVLDLVNILQAVAIFAVFVCNRKTLQELTDKFPRLERINTIIAKASGGVTGTNSSPRKHSTNTVTNISSVFDVPGLDTVELRSEHISSTSQK